MGRCREVRVGEVDVWRQLDVKVVRRVDRDPPGAKLCGEHMPTASAIDIDEVKVVAGDLDPLGVYGEAEADQGPLDRGELEDALLRDDLGQRTVGRLLARDRTGADVVEMAVDPDSAGGRSGG